MNDIKSLSKSLPDTLGAFSIDIIGNITKIRYKGDFSCRIVNHKIRSQISRNKVLLNGGMEDSLDIGTRNMNHMISYLKYCLEDMPEFWKDSDLGYELIDSNIVEEIYNKVLEFESKWMEDIWGKPKEEKKDDGEG